MSDMLPFKCFQCSVNVKSVSKSTIDQKVEHDIFYGAGTCFGENVCIEPNVVIGKNCRIGCNTVIRNGVCIGDDCDIGHLVVLEKGVQIGTESTIQSQCHITAYVKVENNVFFGPGVICANDKRMVKYHPERGRYVVEAPVFKDKSSIGAGSVIMPGVVVGSNVVIGSGSVVSKSVPDNECWYGHKACKRELAW